MLSSSLTQIQSVYNNLSHLSTESVVISTTDSANIKKSCLKEYEMKKWLVVAALAATAVTGLVQAKEWKTVRFGIEGAYPPFSWTEADGSLKGFDVDMANALCNEMQVKCKIVAQDWDGIIPSLLARKYDAIIAAMSITEERKKKVDFTGKYALIPNKFIAKKGANLDFDKLDGQKIAVQRATTHDKYLTDNYGDKVEIVRCTRLMKLILT